MLSTVCSAGFATHIPLTLKLSAAGAVQLASVNAKRLGVPHVVDTEHALHEPQVRVAVSSTVNGWTNGVPAGQTTFPAATMHAEKPEGASPLQTASALVAGTSQKRSVGSERSAGFDCADSVHAPPCVEAESGEAMKFPSVIWASAGTAMHSEPFTVVVSHGIVHVSL